MALRLGALEDSIIGRIRAFLSAVSNDLPPSKALPTENFKSRTRSSNLGGFGSFIFHWIISFASAVTHFASRCQVLSLTITRLLLMWMKIRKKASSLAFDRDSVQSTPTVSSICYDAVHAQQATMFRKRQTELAQMQDRLLTAYLAGTVDAAVFQAKTAALKSELLQVQESLEKVGKSDPARPNLVLKVFDWSQDLVNTWRRSNSTQKREILDTVYSNRALTDVSLVTTKKKPLDVLVEGLYSEQKRGDRTPIELFVEGIRLWEPEMRSLLIVKR